MKQLFLLFFISVSSLVFSQNKLHFGVQANGNFTTGLPVGSTYPASYFKGIETFCFSYSGGFITEYELSESWRLKSGLLFRKSGDKSKSFPVEPFRPIPTVFIYKKYGVELPLNVKFKLNEKFQLIFGASVAYNLFSKYLYTDLEGTFDIAFSGNEINPLDIYANLGIEYQLNNKFSITAYSQFDILKTQYDFLLFMNPERNYLSVGLSVGYQFN